jgi:hypothetical protein|tara:strand:- start:1754 stop:2236 length:483 start_codon:yes stop_codon:yes gene_type:complete
MNPLLQSVQIALQNATQIEAIAFIDKVVDFCIEHENGKVLAGWPEELIRLLVGYHMAKDTLIVEQDEEGNITGVGMWYNCDENADWDFIKNWEPDNKNANGIFLGFLYANSTELFKKMTRKFLKLCPEAMHKKLIMMRHRSHVSKRVESNYRLFNKILAM